MKKSDLKAKAQGVKASVTIGKGGVTTGVIENLSIYLKKNRLVKVKILRSALIYGKEEIAERLAKETNSRVVEIKGNTIVLYK